MIVHATFKFHCIIVLAIIIMHPLHYPGAGYGALSLTLLLRCSELGRDCCKTGKMLHVTVRPKHEKIVSTYVARQVPEGLSLVTNTHNISSQICDL